MRQSHPHLRDSKDSSCTPVLWLPTPGQHTAVVQQVAFHCVSELQLPLHRTAKRRIPRVGAGASVQPADHHGSTCEQRDPATSPAQQLEFTLLHTGSLSRGSAHRRVQRSATLKFASLLAAPAQRTHDSSQVSSRGEATAANARRDSPSLLLAPTGQVWIPNMLCPYPQACAPRHCTCHRS